MPAAPAGGPITFRGAPPRPSAGGSAVVLPPPGPPAHGGAAPRLVPPSVPVDAFSHATAQSCVQRPSLPLKARPAAGAFIPAGRSRMWFLMLAGMLLMLLVVMTPLWDAARLLGDPTFVFFLGHGLPLWTVACCLAALAAYAAVVLAALRPGPLQERCTEQALLAVFAAILGLLGLSFLVLAAPLASQANVTHSQIFLGCQHGVDTQAKVLFEYASSMQALRATPACSSRASVEGCEGYREYSPYSGVLKAMEQTYRCAGYCQPLLGAPALLSAGLAAEAPATANESAAAPAQVELEQFRGRDRARLEDAGPSRLQGRLAAALLRHFAGRRPADARHPHAAQGALAAEQDADGQQQEAGQPAAGAALALLQKAVVHREVREVGVHKRAREELLGKGAAGVHQPTLFSLDNHQASCDGMASRALVSKATDASNVLFTEGLALLFAAALVAMLKVGTTFTEFVDSTGMRSFLETPMKALDQKPAV
ncbi:unnamed protein product [Prorocentrum cordatum]|uniref:Uncharacterized protein n=1 Tax=Prorocentrum cordatum TaxID=2364126 RepID=A0ABN9PML4_9DINO|nr:unnamed protein product [Polarella glacialis]